MARLPFEIRRRATAGAQRRPPPVDPQVDGNRYDLRSSGAASLAVAGVAERADVPRPQLDGETSNVVLGVANWRARFLMRTKIMVQNVNDGGLLAEHPALDVIRQPNDSESGGDFWHRVILDHDTNGNVFLYKLRSRAGGVPVGLQRIDPRLVTVERVAGVKRYKVNRTGRVLPTDDIIHWKHIPDSKGLLGYSPVATLWAELAADREAAAAYWHILRNAGVVGLVAIMDEDKQSYLPIEERKRFFKDLMKQFTGRNRGKPAIAGGGGIKDIKEVVGVAGRINFKHIFDRVEERVSMSYGIPVQVLGFGAGAETPQWGTTVQSLRMEAVVNSGEPMVTALLDVLNCFLMPDFRESNLRYYADFGAVPEVAQLREETLDRRIQRAISLVQAGVYTAEELKNALEGRGSPQTTMALLQGKV